MPGAPANGAAPGLTERDFALAQPSQPGDPLHRPVRGDLAHIRCAGRIFVPHYAVPMPHRVARDTALRQQGRADGAVLTTLVTGDMFNVLDLAGGWAWGQHGDHGIVGYIAQTALIAA